MKKIAVIGVTESIGREVLAFWPTADISRIRLRHWK